MLGLVAKRFFHALNWNMDDDCGEWVESIWVWLVSVVSRRWVWLVGGIYVYGY